MEHNQQLVVLGRDEGENLGESCLRVAPDVEQAAIRLDRWRPTVAAGIRCLLTRCFRAVLATLTRCTTALLCRTLSTDSSGLIAGQQSLMFPNPFPSGRKTAPGGVSEGRFGW